MRLGWASQHFYLAVGLVCGSSLSLIGLKVIEIHTPEFGPWGTQNLTVLQIFGLSMLKKSFYCNFNVIFEFIVKFYPGLGEK